MSSTLNKKQAPRVPAFFLIKNAHERTWTIDLKIRDLSVRVSQNSLVIPPGPQPSTTSISFFSTWSM